MGDWPGWPTRAAGDLVLVAGDL